MYGLIIVGIVGTVIGFGIMLLVVTERNETDDSGARFKVNKTVRKSIRARKESNILTGTTAYMDRNTYNAVRTVLCGICVMIGGMTFNFFIAIIGVVVFLLTIPKEYTKKDRKLPFHMFVQFVRNMDRDKKDDEMMECLSVFKNFIVQTREKPLGADYIIEYLASNTIYIKSPLYRMLGKIRMGRKEEAESTFAEEVGSELAKDFAHLLAQLDEMNPVELEEAVISRQKYISEIRNTKNIRRAQLVSDLVYFPVVVTVMMILMNFMLVAYYLEQCDQMAVFF